MAIPTHVVDSFADLHRVLERYLDNADWYFRGQAQADWPLKPKAGREPYDRVDDRQMFDHWKRWARQYFDQEPKNDWEWLAIAQHHGFATRLLDWTQNALAAAFFATPLSDTIDGAIYAYRPESFVEDEESTPWDVGGVFMYYPGGIATRIVRQWGTFTIHHPPTQTLPDGRGRNNGLERIIIKHDYKLRLRWNLYTYGMCAETLFGDLDGFSQDANWDFANLDVRGPLPPRAGNRRKT